MTVFTVFTVFSHCLFAFASNDDEFLTFSDYETMQAYQWFKMYGFTADSSYSYTDTYSTNGSFSQSANITLSGNGGFSASGTDETEVNGGIQFNPTDDGYYYLNVDPQFTGTLTPTSSSASHLSLSCTYSNPSNLSGSGAQTDYEYAKLTCSDPAFVDVSRYNIDITWNTNTSDVFMYGRNASNLARFTSAAEAVEDDMASVLWLEGVSEFSGNLSLTESGSLSGSGTISLNTTTTNTNKLSYVLPWMNVTSLSNPDPTAAPNTKYRWQYKNTDPFIVCFFSDVYISDPFNFYVSPISNASSANNGDVVFKRAGRFSDSIMIGGMNFICLETKPNLNLESYNVITFNSNYFTGKIIPLYVGHKSYISDSLYRFIYGSDRIIETIESQTKIIETGNINSQQKGQELNTETNKMSNQMIQFESIENNASENMNNALNNINTNPSLISNNKFLISVNWITDQFNRLVTNTPFEAVITFCLVFGLGLLLLGKVR